VKPAGIHRGAHQRQTKPHKQGRVRLRLTKPHNDAWRRSSENLSSCC